MKEILIALVAFLPMSLFAQDADDQVDCSTVVTHIQFESEQRESTTEIKTEEGVYSAPLTAVFSPEPGTSAVFFIWNVYKLNEHESYLHEENLRSENLIIRYTDKVFRYTFRESGSYRIVLEVTDSTNTCHSKDFFPKAEEPALRIDDSFLDAPNVFSPGTSPGVNDEFRIAYKSIVSFKGWIFNRWGKQLFYWTDPDKGWDGKVNGKLVPPGVYFYVVEAKGSDGIDRNKKGHINILRGN
ncbi:MAG: gliding motility-associated C-terminal domain-containing protein [Dysgonamonadaceae bacterium]|jgi:gliding motility-associated-like protein|nr:gliding motility-associated C-terminal domain-containing protein [Dysgonamonadaceae bacterium]